MVLGEIRDNYDVKLPKLDVVGSSPIARSNYIKELLVFGNSFFFCARGFLFLGVNLPSI